MSAVKRKLAPVERSQPWLGTFVRIQVAGLRGSEAHAAIDAAFAEIAAVHRLMSFHAEDSDLSRLNRATPHTAIKVHRYTFETLRCAQQLSLASEGCFDITVGRELVQIGLLPEQSKPSPESGGAWEDIELLEGERVRLRRPLCLDLGGIAKGYAVDRATEKLRERGALHIVVNAGGDLRVSGGPERILLQTELPGEQVPVLELSNGSAASSSGYRNRRQYKGVWYGPHFHGQKRTPVPTDRFACVVARTCVMADGLTKVLLNDAGTGASTLRRFDAVGYLHHPKTGWTRIGEEASADERCSTG